METERPPTNIKQWYKCATNLDRHWRESKREEERIRGRKKAGPQVPRQNQEIQWQTWPKSQIWLKRQEISQQQVQVGTIPIEEVERLNVVMIYPQQRIEGIQRNLYAMDVDRRERRNCYNCRGFGHMVRHCRNKEIGNRIGEGRRLEYRGNKGQRRIEGENGEQNLNGE